MTEPRTTPEKRPVQFTWEGVTYTVDLDEAEAAELDAKMAPFLAAARQRQRTSPAGVTMTPRELATGFGRSPKTIRAWLRATYPRGVDHQQPWHLSREQADAVRAHFGGR